MRPVMGSLNMRSISRSETYGSCCDCCSITDATEGFTIGCGIQMETREVAFLLQDSHMKNDLKALSYLANFADNMVELITP
ncbi:hypothetical protein V6N11_029450 [Hibiscus sabdariffa]|uniref:Uncharacterized protein n=1 Tax=Hibiscus sabdariffa TaxID=183260 RepID=A0ABR2P740_9ROSI